MRWRWLERIGIGLAGLALIASIASVVEQKAGATSAVVERATKCVEVPSGSATNQRLLLVVGASFTAGVGPNDPRLNWAVRLGELLGWRAVTVGDPGVGYSDQGLDHLGPLWRLFRSDGISSLHPSLIIVQAGHDDWRVGSSLEAQRVRNLARLLEQEFPGAKLVFLTAFSSEKHSTGNHRVSTTNSTIVSAIHRSDPKALVIDPVAWRFARSSGGLHPTAAGDLSIAERVARAFSADGIDAQSTSHLAKAAVNCSDLGPERTVRYSSHRVMASGTG